MIEFRLSSFTSNANFEMKGRDVASGLRDRVKGLLRKPQWSEMDQVAMAPNLDLFSIVSSPN